MHKRSLYEKYLKRVFDISFSLIFMIIFLPILLIFVIAVKLNLGSPVLFKQLRPGKNERIFTLYKFRSMTNKKDETGKLLPDSQRITKFGRFLRTTSIDELPELINIFLGHMSFVGPRPLAVQYLKYYTTEEKKRHSVRPGLTGLAQINGRNKSSWENKFKNDILYCNSISFLGDLRILFLTFISVIKRKDIGERGEGVLQDFDIYRKEKISDGKE
jgi:undecaprenyl phosphate N,N'-diacetylbacillosamine 1-phosphate transferase